jgi:nitrile hydratase subunit beta
MNGAHDMGGVMGHGPVTPEPNEPVFHGRWEERVLAMTVAMGPAGGWNIDQSRFSRENVPPQKYLSQTYYEIWLAGLTRLLEARGLIAADELSAGHMLHPAKAVPRVLAANDVSSFITAGRSAERPVATPARFKVGDRVRAKNIHPAGHTRLPRYVRGHIGVVTMLHGGHVYPDTNARGEGEDPQWLYTVDFAASTLWGEGADPTVTVSVDAWESYLDATL